MNKKEFIETLLETIDFLDFGTSEYGGTTYHGHPKFYFLHTKEEFNNELYRIIENKEIYDEYDIYYYLSYMIKYSLNRYDSHTRLRFKNDVKDFAFIIRIFDNKPYIVDSNINYKEYIGLEIERINDIDISVILSELKKITCHNNKDELTVFLEYNLVSPNVLKSLPIFHKCENFEITFESNKRLNLSAANKEAYCGYLTNKNYTYEIKDDVVIIKYCSCKDKDKMINLINEISKISNVNKYIIDLRGNCGGNSEVNIPLINFLNGKQFVVLIDQYVFSSGKWCALSLKKIGAKLIGTSICAPLSAFGNCLMIKMIKNFPIMVYGSTTYYYWHDVGLEFFGFYKEKIDYGERNFQGFYDFKFLTADIEIKLTLNDYLNHKDPVKEYALEYLKKQKS